MLLLYYYFAADCITNPIIFLLDKLYLLNNNGTNSLRLILSYSQNFGRKTGQYIKYYKVGPGETVEKLRHVKYVSFSLPTFTCWAIRWLEVVSTCAGRTFTSFTFNAVVVNCWTCWKRVRYYHQVLPECGRRNVCLTRDPWLKLRRLCQFTLLSDYLDRFWPILGIL